MGRELRGPVQARLLFTGNISKVVTTSFEVLPVTGTVPGHHHARHRVIRITRAGDENDRIRYSDAMINFLVELDSVRIETLSVGISY